MFLFHVLPKISVRLADVGAEIASEEEAVVHGALVDLEVVLLSSGEVAHVAVVADPEVLRLPVLLQIVGAGGDVITLITRISNTLQKENCASFLLGNYDKTDQPTNRPNNKPPNRQTKGFIRNYSSIMILLEANCKLS